MSALVPTPHGTPAPQEPVAEGALLWTRRCSCRLGGAFLAALAAGLGACGVTPLPWARPVDVVAGPLPSGPPAPPDPGLRVDVPPMWAPLEVDPEPLDGLRDVWLGEDPRTRIELSPALVEGPWRGLAARWIETWGAEVVDVAVVEATPLSQAWRAAAAHRRAPIVAHWAFDAAPFAVPTDRADACAALEVELSVAYDEAMTRAAPFFVHADAVLWQVYRAALGAVLPSLRDGFDVAEGALAPTCAAAHRDLLARAATCADADGRCDLAPRFDPAAGARMTSAALPPLDLSCVRAFGRDVRGDLERIAFESAEVAAGYLDPAWVHRVERLAALADLRDEARDACRPLPRRIAPDEAPELRLGLEALVEALEASSGDRGEWTIHAPSEPRGVSKTRLLAEFESSPGSVASRVEEGARTWGERVVGQAPCVGATDAPPLRLTVVDVAEAQVRFTARVFAEDLICPQIPAVATTDPAVDGRRLDRVGG